MLVGILFKLVIIFLIDLDFKFVFFIVVFNFVIYVLWCLLWWIFIVFLLKCGFNVLNVYGNFGNLKVINNYFFKMFVSK